MPRPDRAVTRQRLLEAGTALAPERSLAALTVDEVVAHAGCAKGTFFTHFPTRAGYFVELHRRFHDRIASQVDDALRERPEGRERLLAGSIAYLDACLHEHAVKALLVEARVLPEIRREIEHQNQRFDGLAERQFAAMRWPSPRHASLLWVALVAEAALAEADSGRKLPALREQLPRFLGAN